MAEIVGMERIEDEPGTIPRRGPRVKRFPGSPALTELIAPKGESWLEYRRTLKPNYLIVWGDIALSYVMMIVGLVVQGVLHHEWGPSAWLAVPVSALWVGYWFNSLVGFGHEAAHFNLARNPSRSDRLSEWFVFPWLALTVRTYRPIHWKHHLHLGDHGDSEISYHNCLSPWFLTKTLTGIYLAQVLIRYATPHDGKSGAAGADPGEAGARESPSRRNLGQFWGLARTATLHLLVVVIAAALGYPSVSVVWLLTVLLLAPFFSTVHQILEHRSLEATCDQDFRVIEHGPVNRMFGTGLLSRYFGSAGFNRHLLHHWDPSISYTCFDEMEAFLLRTPAASEIEASRTTYLRTFVDMLRSAHRA